MVKIEIEKEVKLAFTSAESQGLNIDDYMYMYSTNGVDYFKNIITRKYRAFTRI
tara:strand:+ start:1104 stop:1265 length:162 start_codon:yes stop_codon:yes gene_type:complete